MPDLTCHAFAPEEQLAVGNDASTDACTHGHINKVLTSLPTAKVPLTKSGSMRIVMEDHWQACLVLKKRSQWQQWRRCDAERCDRWCPSARPVSVSHPGPHR